MSDEQIRSGTRWREVIGKALDSTDFGIICLTRANQHEPWLVFEAGALAKRLDVARLVPLFIDVASSEVTGPLEGWQGQRLDREGVRRLVYDLNEAADRSVPEGSLGDLFDAMWPQLESAVNAAKALAPDSDESNRSEKDMLAELVDRTRRIEDLLPAAETANEPFSVVFTKPFIRYDALSKKESQYQQGTTGTVTRLHTGPLGEISRVDVRLEDGNFIGNVPIDFFKP
jgi:hypothetical protein